MRLLKKLLGSNCFDDDSGICGHFWGILQTWPFMRVLQVIVHTSFESGEYELCTYVSLVVCSPKESENSSKPFLRRTGKPSSRCSVFAGATTLNNESGYPRCC